MLVPLHSHWLVYMASRSSTCSPRRRSSNSTAVLPTPVQPPSTNTSKSPFGRKCITNHHECKIAKARSPIALKHE